MIAKKNFARNSARRHQKKFGPTLVQSKKLIVRPRAPRWLILEARSKKGVLVCPSCQAIYYDKHWHTWSNEATRLPAERVLTAGFCHACKATKNKKVDSSSFGYVGEVILKGLKDSERKQAIIKLIRNAGNRALKRDPEDQIIRIEDRGQIVRITTSENQLAVSIAKQIDAAMKGGEMKISWSKEDMPVRVTWTDHK